MTDEQWDGLMGVNLLAPAHIIRRLTPNLKERGEAHIVNIASLCGLVGMRKVAAYSLTKFGLVGFSEALRGEFDRFGVGVTAVCPAFVQTNFFRDTLTSNPAKRAREPSKILCLSPDQIAVQVVKAIRKNRALVVPGFGARTFWRLHRFAPWLSGFLLNGRGKRHSPPPVSTPAREIRGAA